MLTPNSGVRQGCPLSPTLSLMLILPIVRKKQQVSVHVTFLLHVDDLLSLFPATLILWLEGHVGLSCYIFKMSQELSQCPFFFDHIT